MSNACLEIEKVYLNYSDSSHDKGLSMRNVKRKELKSCPEAHMYNY